MAAGWIYPGRPAGRGAGPGRVRPATYARREDRWRSTAGLGRAQRRQPGSNRSRWPSTASAGSSATTWGHKLASDPHLGGRGRAGRTARAAAAAWSVMDRDGRASHRQPRITGGQRFHRGVSGGMRVAWGCPGVITRLLHPIPPGHTAPALAFPGLWARSCGRSGGDRRSCEAHQLVEAAGCPGDAVQDQPERSELVIHAFVIGAA
jgi:hypothetical protein